MERLRRFLQAGVTCFVDLTESRELPSYEALLPFSTPEGRRVEYLREPIADHGVPQGREVMERALAMIDDALAAGHVVYLHCRAGLGRSATVAGCWLARRSGVPAQALEELQRCFQQSAKAQFWQQVPETEEQSAYVLGWTSGAVGRVVVGGTRNIDPVSRIRGALIGLAVGDAVGSANGRDGTCSWSQHTALTLCLAESLIERGRLDARDLIERFLRWQRDGHLAADGRPGTATPDVAKALANYQWRGQPMAGSHDPRDRSTAALPRVVAAVLYALRDAEAAVALAADCARVTHQSPLVLDTCRLYAAILAGLLRGEDPGRVLGGAYEPVAGLWTRHPLKPAVRSMAAELDPPQPDAQSRKTHAADAVAALARARDAVARSSGFADAIERAREAAVEPGLEAALAGTLSGAIGGADSIPRDLLGRLPRLDLIETLAERLARVAKGEGV
jgi:ADP-ribosylglycohydrolase